MSLRTHNVSAHISVEIIAFIRLLLFFLSEDNRYLPQVGLNAKKVRQEPLQHSPIYSINQLNTECID